MGLPENIDALLVNYDITPSTLAKIAGVSTATVSRSIAIDTEKRPPPEGEGLHHAWLLVLLVGYPCDIRGYPGGNRG